MEITSSSNTKVKKWIKYHQKKYRDQDHCFLVEGEHLIEEAIQANALQVLLVRMNQINPFSDHYETYYVSDEIMDRLSTNVSQVNYIGVCIQKQVCFANFKKVLLLDDIQDPGNLGTIIRSAYSFGFEGVFVSKGCVDLYNEKVIRSTQGALFHLPVKQVDLKDLIPILQSKGYTVYATALAHAQPLSQYENIEQVALVFGNEGSGVHKDIIALCDASIKIEMMAFESLNVAVAAGICMYHFRKETD
ncbi:MAG: RNA methyltransferase [Erysipelotrichia bacterium]|nr:RNA methyltransferase [Erysipelotrichia bacterium]NCC53899.1 RNA methyltransferase [Erysipelotrichia bacterium]